jgi:SAM-dependent methyltransferase
MGVSPELRKLAAGLLVCPSCRQPLTFAEAVSCERCGTSYESAGSIVNFLGSQPQPAPSVAESELAKRLLDNLEAVAAELSLAEAPHTDEKRRSEAFERLGTLLGGLGGGQAAKILYSMPLGQVMNDLRHYFYEPTPLPPSFTDQFLRTNFSRESAAVVLDVGCSVCRHLAEAAPFSTNLVGVDLSTLSLRIGTEAWTRRRDTAPPLLCGADALKLPFRSSCFTHVLSFVVLGLVPLRVALREFHRVLRPGGQLVFTIEGVGFWQECWDAAPRLSRQRLGLVRWWLGRQLLFAGIQWRGVRGISRLAGLTQYSAQILHRELRATHFEVVKIEILRQYRGKPRLLGVVARK